MYSDELRRRPAGSPGGQGNDMVKHVEGCKDAAGRPESTDDVLQYVQYSIKLVLSWSTAQPSCQGS